MKKIQHQLVLAITVLLVSSLLTGCSNKTAATTVLTGNDGKLLQVIKLQKAAGTTTDANYIAEKLGFFKEVGLQPEWVGTIPSAEQVQSVLAGKVDVSGSHVNRDTAAISAGAKIKAVVAMTETTKELPHMTFVVLKDSPIKTAQDVVGKKVGIPYYGGCMEYTPYEYLRKAGIADPKAASKLVIVPVGQEIQALRQGEVDVVALNINPNYVLKTEKDIRQLYSDFDIWGTVGGATPQFFSTDFIQKKPDVVKAYVTAFAKAENWINDNPDKAVEIISQDFKIDKDKVVVMHYAKDGIIKEDSVQVWIDTQSFYHEIKPGLKPADIYTNEFNPNLK